jgi:inhibitor of cysteine peptidase
VEADSIEYAASGSVPGYVLNQFSMDEYSGYFRIATTGSSWRLFSGGGAQNNVYVLDMNLKVVGSIEDLAPGETIYSARFVGKRGYLVTFKKIDPLFVIDLENPTSPSVLGYLKVTGYSGYLQPYDETHLLGIGKETVAAEEGDFAWYQGVKISLFDVADVEHPVEIGKYEIGDRGTDSPVLSNHKALLFDRARNLLVLPVALHEIDPAKYYGEVPPNAYGDLVWQGAYVFNVSAADGLALEGRITHLKSDVYDYEHYVKRALYIDNVLFTISDKTIKMNNLATLEEINEVQLP